MTTGTILRAGRFFEPESGRSLVVAFDHGLLTRPSGGGVDVEKTLQRVLDGDPDGVVLAPGIAGRCAHMFAHRGSPSLIVRADYLSVGAFQRGAGEHHRLVATAERAAADGADALMVFLAVGVREGAAYADNVAAVASIVEHAHAVGLPVFVETVAWGATVTDQQDTDILVEGCRLASELGADVVKTQYPGSERSMRTIIEACPAPVMVLGGSKVDHVQLFAQTDEALAAGAAGCVYGRNVWQDDDPASLCRQLAERVHGSVGVGA